MSDEVISELIESNRATTGRWAICLSDRSPSEVRWLWAGRIPLGKITLLSGDPGLGKSLVTLDLAARLTRGAAMPEAVGPPSRGGYSVAASLRDADASFGETHLQSGSVVVLSAEDDVDDTIVPRLLAGGADMSRIHIPDESRLRSASQGRERHGLVDLKTQLDVLEKVVADVPDCRLVIVDPISAYCGSVDAHRNASVRALLAPLAALAACRGIAVLAVNHLNKSHGGPMIYRSMGSLAFAAAARNVLAVVADPKNAGGRLLLSVKSNLHTPPPGLRFTVEQAVDGVCGAGPASERPATERTLPRIVWRAEPVNYSPGEMMPIVNRAPTSSGLVDACEWLASVLAGGPVASAEIKRLASEAGIAERTLWRAKERLGVVANCVGQSGPGATYVWQLPVVDDDAGSRGQGAGEGVSSAHSFPRIPQPEPCGAVGVTGLNDSSDVGEWQQI